MVAICPFSLSQSTFWKYGEKREQSWDNQQFPLFSPPPTHTQCYLPYQRNIAAFETYENSETENQSVVSTENVSTFANTVLLFISLQLNPYF